MNWHDYHLSIAKSVAQKSKDPSSKVGCVIVDENNAIVSTGFNGMVQGADESKLSWERPQKYHLVVHAEANAIIFAKRDLKNCTAYVTDAPCEVCLKLLLQSKVRTIVYSSPEIMQKRSSKEQKEAIKALIESTGANVVNVNGTAYIEDLNETV